MTLRIYWKDVIAVSILSALVVFVLHHSLFTTYLRFPIIPGSDTQGHMELGKYYAQHIFPATWGWAGQWYGGMPFPQFYPPMFYIVVAAASKILLFISYETVFRIIVVVLPLCIPGLLTIVATRIIDEKTGLYATGIAGALLLATAFGWYDNLGVSLSSTLSVGLVTHALAFNFFLLWLWAFLGRKQSQVAYILSIFFLACVALSSVHIVPLAIIVFVSALALDWKYIFYPRLLMQYYLVPGLLAVGLTGFWFVPLLGIYKYMPSQSLTILEGLGTNKLLDLIRTWWLVGLFFVVACVCAVYRKNKTALVILLSGIFTFAPHVLHFDELLPQFPLHPYRLLPYIYFSGALYVGYIVDSLVKNRSKIFAGWLVVCITLLFIITWAPYSASEINLDHYQNYESEKAFLVANYLRDKKGMFAVEAANTGRYMQYLIQAGAQNDLRSNYTVFVDSSLSSLFDVPMRTNLSAHDHEKISVYTALANDPNITSVKNPNAIADRAKALGINYLVIRSPNIRTAFNTNKRFKLEKDFGIWAIYSLPEVSNDISEVVPFEPALVFAPLGNKGKKTDSLSYLYLQERAYSVTQLDVPMAYANNLSLDNADAINTFRSIVISSYFYHSKQKALDTLVAYAKDHRLVAVESSDEFYAALKDALKDNQNATFIDLPSHQENDIRIAANSVLHILDKNKVTVPVSRSTALIDDNTITIESHGSTTVPILIKESYFPSWKREDHKLVYMASPTYMLTFIEGNTTMKFTTPPTVYIGYLVSLISLSTIGWQLYRAKKSL